MNKLYCGTNEVKGNIKSVIDKVSELIIIMDNDIIINLDLNRHDWKFEKGNIYFINK